MKKFFSEFRQFISKGNILDMAIGVIIGAAFNTVVTTLNKQILMPIVNYGLSYVSGGSQLCTVLPNYILYDPVIHEGATPIIVNGISYYSVNYINWSAFIEACFNFLFISLTLFIILKIIKFAAQKRAELCTFIKEKNSKEKNTNPEDEVTSVDTNISQEPEKDPMVILLEEIRDSIKEKN